MRSASKHACMFVVLARLKRKLSVRLRRAVHRLTQIPATTTLRMSRYDRHIQMSLTDRWICVLWHLNDLEILECGSYSRQKHVIRRAVIITLAPEFGEEVVNSDVEHDQPSCHILGRMTPPTVERQMF